VLARDTGFHSAMRLTQRRLARIGPTSHPEWLMRQMQNGSLATGNLCAQAVTGIKRNAQCKVARLVFGKKAEAEKSCRLIGRQRTPIGVEGLRVSS
jgi:hypothetical protein